MRKLFQLGGMSDTNEIAESLIEGPLADTVAQVTKVSTSPSGDVPNYQHVICLYIPDVYNKEEVLEVGHDRPNTTSTEGFSGNERPSQKTWSHAFWSQV